MLGVRPDCDTHRGGNRGALGAIYHANLQRGYLSVVYTRPGVAAAIPRRGNHEVWRRAYVWYALSRTSDRTSPDQSAASLDQRAGRTYEPYNQRRDRETVSLRQPRTASRASCRLHGRLQLRAPLEDAQRSHVPRVHMQIMDKRARKIQSQSDPPHAATEHLRISC